MRQDGTRTQFQFYVPRLCEDSYWINYGFLQNAIIYNRKEVLIMDYDEAWNRLLENDIATQEELELVTAINGENVGTLTDILYVRTGSRDFNDI